MNHQRENPFFSIIVPIYNIEKYLIECLESICNQIFLDYEVILIDDGSPDCCPKICDEYCKKNPKMRVIHKKNEGLVEARKTGILEAKGKYTVFVDGDDWIDQRLLEEAYLIAKDKATDIIVFDYFRNSGNRQEICRFKISPGYYTGERKKKEVCEKMICSGKYYEFGMAPSIATKIFKTELIKDRLMQVDKRITMGEDAVVTYPAILQAENIMVSSQAFYHYRDVQESMSQKYDLKYFEKIEILMEWFYKKNFNELEAQLKFYRLMLLEEGILRLLVQSPDLLAAIKEVKRICNQEKYKEILNQVDVSDVNLDRKKVIVALKNSRYVFLYLRFAFMRLKRKIKQILRK